MSIMQKIPRILTLSGRVDVFFLSKQVALTAEGALNDLSLLFFPNVTKLKITIIRWSLIQPPPPLLPNPRHLSRHHSSFCLLLGNNFSLTRPGHVIYYIWQKFPCTGIRETSRVCARCLRWLVAAHARHPSPSHTYVVNLKILWHVTKRINYFL